MINDFQYYKNGLGITCSYNELNELFINNLIDEKLEVIDSDSSKSIDEYLYAIGMLEWWLEINNSTKNYLQVFQEYLFEKYKNK